MTTNKVKSHSTRSLLCLILFRKNIFCRGQSLDACYQRFMTKGCKYATKCQCPLGLIPHFYDERSYNMARNDKSACQCPLGLIPHFFENVRKKSSICNSQRCQCPLGLIPHFYGKNQFQYR